MLSKQDFVSDALTIHQKSIVDFCIAWLNHQTHFDFHTSGSTGIPKLISLSSEQLLASARSTISALSLSSSHHALLCLSPQTIAGSMMVVRAMECDMPLTIIEPQLHPFQQLENNHTISFAACVPAQLYNLNEAEWQRFNRMQTVLIGGSSIPADLEAKLKSATPRIYHTYGMTETASHVALREIHTQQYFKPLPGIEVKQDERGCLCIKGEVTQNEWLVTNDSVIFHKSGFEITGRWDNVIISGGVKVQPEKVEAAIRAIHLLDGFEFIVGALPHPQWGQEVVLIVESASQPDIDFEKLQQALKSELQSAEIPKRVFWLKQFCRIESSKVQRHQTIKMLIA